jgi:putative ABC transport system permease protein
MNAIPGVEQVAFTSDLPAKGRPFTAAMEIEGRPAESGQDLSGEIIRITPDYFKLMQVPLVRGRFFNEDDRDGNQKVVMIDESTARRYWIDQDPIGRRIRTGPPTNPWWTVVGIVRDVKNDGLDADTVPHIYETYDQVLGRTVGVLLRTSLPAADLDAQIRREAQSVDPGLPVFGVSSMSEVLDSSLAPRRFSADMVGAFAGVALLLASVGIYGLLAYMVGQRSREIGLRIALGAGRSDILKLVLGKGFLLAATGIMAGIFFAATGASMMSSLLYGVQPHDPIVFVGVAVILQLVAVLASWIPAMRAARVDPMAALREA